MLFGAAGGVKAIRFAHPGGSVAIGRGVFSSLRALHSIIFSFAAAITPRMLETEER